MKNYVIVFFLLFLVPFAVSAYSIDQNKVVMVPGGDVNSASYQTLVASQQGFVGEMSSAGYTTQVGWIYTLRSSNLITIAVYSPVQDGNINSNPTVSFDVNRTPADDVNGGAIGVDLNGTPSVVFDYLVHCTDFSGSFYCSYSETGLSQDADNNIAIKAAAKGLDQNFVSVERLVHYDATAPTIASVSASASGNDVAVSWGGSDSFTGIEDYYVREGDSAWINAGLGTSYTFSEHAASTYTYYVKARDFADNNSLVSNVTYTSSAGSSADDTPAGGGLGGLPGGSSTVPEVEGIFDFNIVRLDDPVEVSEDFDFTYVVKNSSFVGDNAYIEYWLEKAGEVVVSGSETIYLDVGEGKEFSGSLLLEKMDGSFTFFITLTRPVQDRIEKSRPITIMFGAPTVVDLDISSFEPGFETEPVSFSIGVSSNKDKPVVVLVEEKIFQEGEIVWEKKQDVVITVFQRFLEEVYGLPVGEYLLEVSTTFEGETKTVMKEFERKPMGEVLPVVPFLPKAENLFFSLFDFVPWLLLLLGLLWVFLSYNLLWKKGFEFRERTRVLKLAFLALFLLTIVIVFLFCFFLKKVFFMG